MSEPCPDTFPLFPEKGEKSVVVSVSIPTDLRDDIADLAAHMRVSRSALVTTVLSGVIPDLLRMVENHPWMVEDDDGQSLFVPPQRLRGTSISEVQKRLNRLLSYDPVYRDV